MDERQFTYLQEMGISLWISRENGKHDSLGPQKEVSAPTENGPLLQPEIPMDSGPRVEAPSSILEPDHAPNHKIEAADELPLDWAGLQGMVSRCRRCPELASQRTQTVFGMGDPQADWLIIGEAPAAEEDLRGEPFTGRAGQLLDAMLRAIGLKRSQVYIANIIKCHPSDNRDPKPEEFESCSGYLQQQIDLIQPGVVLVVGENAARMLLKSSAPVAQLRGKVHQLDLPESTVPLIVTYHPTYLLGKPAEKAEAWRDLQLARNVFNR